MVESEREGWADASFYLEPLAPFITLKKNKKTASYFSEAFTSILEMRLRRIKIGTESCGGKTLSLPC